MPDVEQPTPSGGDGALAQAQARVREIGASVFDAFITHHNRSPRQAADWLAEQGYYGRGGERYNDSTLIGWRKGEYAPNAWVFIAAILDAGLSLDEMIWGSGLRSEVDRLKEAMGDRDSALSGLRRDVQLLRDIVTSHLQLPPGQVADLERIAGPEVD